MKHYTQIIETPNNTVIPVSLESFHDLMIIFEVVLLTSKSDTPAMQYRQ